MNISNSRYLSEMSDEMDAATDPMPCKFGIAPTEENIRQVERNRRTVP
jgi:hypothetical protein